jgi:hypothetical protein
LFKKSELNAKMNRSALSTGKEFVLIAWQDSDVPDLIKDKSYGGKLNKG